LAHLSFRILLAVGSVSQYGASDLFNEDADNASRIFMEEVRPSLSSGRSIVILRLDVVEFLIVLCRLLLYCRIFRLHCVTCYHAL
jgi:hypothetical protein